MTDDLRPFAGDMYLRVACMLASRVLDNVLSMDENFSSHCTDVISMMCLPLFIVTSIIDALCLFFSSNHWSQYDGQKTKYNWPLP